jgi:hypothetical protein
LVLSVPLVFAKVVTKTGFAVKGGNNQAVKLEEAEELTAYSYMKK